MVSHGLDWHFEVTVVKGTGRVWPRAATGKQMLYPLPCDIHRKNGDKLLERLRTAGGSEGEEPACTPSELALFVFVAPVPLHGIV